jgi:hypothetical protein
MLTIIDILKDIDLIIGLKMSLSFLILIDGGGTRKLNYLKNLFKLYLHQNG